MTRARRKLILLGAGGLAREVLWTATAIPEASRIWDLTGVLDDNVGGASAVLAAAGVSLPVLGTISDHQPTPEQVFLAAIGSPEAKLRCAGLIQGRGGEFVNVIHPTATVAPDARLGIGIYLFVHAVISVGASVADHVAINAFAGVGHDASVAEGCTISSHVDITAAAKIARGVFLGSHAAVMPNTSVGEFAVVGAGSVALGKIPARATVMGVPARSLKFR